MWRLVDSPAGARFVPPDSLVYIRDGQLVSQRLNLEARALQGPVRVIADSVASTTAGRAGFSVSSTGVIAIASGAPTTLADAVWVDRSGGALSDAGNPIPMAAGSLRLSHRGQLLAYTELGSADRATLVMHDVVRHISWKLSDVLMGDGTATMYAFSTDDRRVYYRAPGANGAISLYEQEVSGATPPIKRFEVPAPAVANVFDVTPDGERLLFNQTSTGAGSLWFVGLAPGGTPSEYLKVLDSRVRAAISPDGRFVAYSVAPMNQVFVQPFPDASGGKWPVSSGGARLPRWRQDGRELYFVDTAARLMAAPVTLSPRFQIGDAVPLFDLSQSELEGGGYAFDASPDGQRFIVARRRATTLSLTVLVNWPALSKTLAGVDAAAGKDGSQ